MSEAAYLGDRIHYRVTVPGLAAPLAVSVNNLQDGAGFALGAGVGVDWDAGAGLILGP
ncbi:TOBE domain-containing protein [Albidovulum sp.]|uniref:TOBE domain-containing protein n=1 Tax=Albidovulum sp. TaxID=1872424 RepID=UPI003528989C